MSFSSENNDEVVTTTLVASVTTKFNHMRRTKHVSDLKSPLIVEY